MTMQKGAGGGGMNELVRQAARMQRKVETAREEIRDREVTGTAAGERARAIVTCEGKIKQLLVDPAFLQEEGLDMTLDALVAATNAALSAADKLVEDHVAKATGGVKLPGKAR
jgi:nucleoid-associated protein EbfC